jgi:hypothetical protein
MKMTEVREWLAKSEAELIEYGDYRADELVLWAVFTKKNHENNALKKITPERWERWLSLCGDDVTDYWGQTAVENWNDSQGDLDDCDEDDGGGRRG